VLAAAARYGLEHQLDTLAQDHALARALASALDGAGGARVVPPDTNIVMLDLPHAAADEVVAAVSAVGVRASVWSTTRVRFVLHRDIPADALTALVPGVAEAVARALVGAPTSG
jgi:threonine aldolase